MPLVPIICWTRSEIVINGNGDGGGGGVDGGSGFPMRIEWFHQWHWVSLTRSDLMNDNPAYASNAGKSDEDEEWQQKSMWVVGQ